MEASFARSAYLLGMIPGPAVAGFFADRYGRCPMAVVTNFLTAVFALATAFIPHGTLSFWTLRFCTGLTASAANVIGYIWSAEFTTVRNQNVFNLIFGLASKQLPEAFYIAVALWLQEWRMLHAACAQPHLLVLCFPLFMPESPRWLLAVGKRRAGATVMSRIAGYNGKSPTDKTTIMATVTEGALIVDECKHKKPKAAEDSWKLLFTNKIFRLRLVLLLYCWIVMNITLYSLNYFTVRLEENPFLIATILCGLGAISLCTKTALLMWFDSKKAILCCYILTAFLSTACAITLHFFPANIVNVVLATVAFSITYCLFNMLYTIVPGLFPTASQNFAMGICYGFSRIGAILATFVEKLDDVTGKRWTPIAVLSIVLSVNVLVVLALPMTSKAHSTVEEEDSEPNSDNIELRNTNI